MSGDVCIRHLSFFLFPSALGPIKRNISFERITTQIENGKFLDIVDNSNKKQYPNQKIYIVEYENYAYLVPFVQEDNKIFLKSIIPNRKATKKHLRK